MTDGTDTRPQAAAPVPARGWRRAWKTVQALPAAGLIFIVRAYRLLLKPWLGNACRFEPTCSAYALEALKAHGAVRGGALTGARLLRCHPWCEGGLDPVPSHFRPLHALARWRPGRPGAGLFTSLLTPSEPVAGTPDAAAPPSATASNGGKASEASPVFSRTSP